MLRKRKYAFLDNQQAHTRKKGKSHSLSSQPKVTKIHKAINFVIILIHVRISILNNNTSQVYNTPNLKTLESQKTSML